MACFAVLTTQLHLKNFCRPTWFYYAFYKTLRSDLVFVRFVNIFIVFYWHACLNVWNLSFYWNIILTLFFTPVVWKQEQSNCIKKLECSAQAILQCNMQLNLPWFKFKMTSDRERGGLQFQNVLRYITPTFFYTRLFSVYYENYNNVSKSLNYLNVTDVVQIEKCLKTQVYILRFK